MSLCFGQKRHRRGKEQREDYQDAHGIECRVAIANRCQLVHRHHGKDKKNEDDECNDEPNKSLDAGR